MDTTIEKTSADQTKVPTQIIQTENNLVNDYDIDAYLTKRKEFITKLGSKMVEGKDFHVIQGKKSLAKGGAEKIAAIFGWTAEFVKDQEVSESFKIEGLIALTCNLSKSGQRVGQGRGASTLGKNAGDPNKTIKMAQKSAFIDAVLRSSGLSDLYSQDLEDMPTDTIKAHQTQTGYEYLGITPKAPQTQKSAITAEKTPIVDKVASDKQVGLIRTLMKQKEIAKLSDIGLREEKPLSSAYASTIIKRLMEYKAEDKVIQMEDLPQ